MKKVFLFLAEDDESSITKNVQPTKFDKINENGNSSSSDYSSHVLRIDENANACPCPNEGKY